MMVLAEAYFHTLDPFAVQFPPSWPVAGIRWYGLSYAAGFLCAWLLLRWFAATRRSPLTVQQAGDLMFAIILGVLLGGRLGYALFYDRHLFIGFVDSFPFWDLLAINKGGMSSHGGVVGVIIACGWFGRRQGIDVLHLYDMSALGGTAGLFMGRLANFVNGELHGRAVADQANPPWWSMKFPQEMTEWSAAKLGSLQDVVQNIGISSAEWLAAVGSSSGDPALPYGEATPMVENTVQRLIHETQTGNQTVIEALRPHLTAFYPSQIIQALTDGPILAGFLCLLWLRPRKPGVIAMWWLIGYGGLRIISELWREPDQGVALTFGLISRGQTLSVLMILAGAAGLYLTARRDVPKMGGLFKR